MIQQVIQFDIFSCRLNSFINGDYQLISLLDRQLSFCIHNGLNTSLDELLLEYVEILEVVLFVDEVMLQRGDGSLHIENTNFLSLQPQSAYSHEMSHDCFGGNDSKLVIPFLIAKELDGHHFLSPLDKFEVLLLGKFKTCDLIMQNTHVSE